MGVNTCGAVPSPCVNRDRKQRSSACSVGIFSGNSDGRLAGDLVDVIGVAEACCGSSVLESPLGSGVQPDGGCNLVDVFNLIGVDKQVVLTAGLNLAVAYGLTNERNDGIGSVGSNGYLSCHLCYVALLVRDLEGDVMNAIGQCKVTGVDLACRELAGNSLTVHINLRAGAVDAGRIAGVVDHILNCVGSERKNVGLNSRTVKGVSVQVVKCERVGDDRSITIVNNVGVVEGDVVDVEGYVLSALSGGRNDPLDESGSVVGSLVTSKRTVGILVVGGGYICGGNIVEIAVYISPACFGDLVACQLGEALLNILICKVQISCADSSVRSLVGVRQSGAGAYSLFGDVHPHTETGAGDAVSGVTEYLGVAGVVQIAVHPVLEGSALGIVKGIAESVVAGVNLAVFAGSKESAFLDTCGNIVACSGSPVGLNALVRHCVAAGVSTAGDSFFHSSPVEPFGDVAVLEVKENFAALTKGNGYGDGSHIRILVDSGHGTAGDGLIGGRIIHKALHGARCHGEIISGSRSIHLSAVVHGVNGEV